MRSFYIFWPEELKSFINFSSFFSIVINWKINRILSITSVCRLLFTLEIRSFLRNFLQLFIIASYTKPSVKYLKRRFSMDKKMYWLVWPIKSLNKVSLGIVIYEQKWVKTGHTICETLVKIQHFKHEWSSIMGENS